MLESRSDDGDAAQLMRASTLTTAMLALAGMAMVPATNAQGTLRAERLKRGDTTIVHTISGSVWPDTMTLVPELSIGSADGADPYIFGRYGVTIDVDAAGRIYALDRQAIEVRMFDANGKHLRNIGRKGGGPGEFENPNDMRVFPDGRVLIREQPGRFTLFAPDGAYKTSWRLITGFGSGTPVYITNDERVLNHTLTDRLVWYTLDGKADTIPEPKRGPPQPMLNIIQEHSRTSYSIPYTRYSVWTLTNDGRFIIGYNERYEIDVAMPDRTTMRITRDVAPVPVPAGEAAYEKASTIANIRQHNDPNFQWNGPPIPATKPAFDEILPGRDGTIWVARQGASREVRNPDYDPKKPQTGRPTEWRSPVAYDVFDAQGRYLGAVKLPQGTWLFHAVLTTERVWTVANHPDGYQQIVRYRVTPQK